MKLTNEKRIRQDLRMVAPTRIAVAYVGGDWKTYIDPKTLQEIILSPTIGSNPEAIEEIANAIGWEHVYFLDNLHSKIYLGAQSAACGSFNLTANGLSGTALREAGFIVEDEESLTELRALIDEYRAQAIQAYPEVKDKLKCLGKLIPVWRRGFREGVIVDTASNRALKDYVLGTDNPYICGYHDEIEFTDEVTVPASVEDYLGLLETDEIQRDKWVLCWRSCKDGALPKNSIVTCYWLYIDEVVKEGGKNTRWSQVALQRTGKKDLPPPFEITDDVKRALHAVLSSGDFPEFIASDEHWLIKNTVPRLPAFLQALQKSEASLKRCP